MKETAKKQCTQCESMLALDRFGVSAGSVDGLNTRCRACVRSANMGRTQRKNYRSEGKHASLLYALKSQWGPIKIGRTTNLDHRLTDIRNAHPGRLDVVAVVPGGADEEWLVLHECQSHSLVHGGKEWFQPQALPLALSAMHRYGLQVGP